MTSTDHRMADVISDPGHPDQMDTDGAVHPDVHREAREEA